MKDCFKVIGYYICEINDAPGWLQGISRQILSVSGCIGEQHPRCECGKYGMKGYLRYCSGFKRKLSGMPLKACSISFRLYTNNSEKTFSPLCEANLRNLSSVLIFSGICECQLSMSSEKCSKLCFMASVYFSILPNC